MRAYCTKSVNYNLLNVFTETIELTFIHKYLKSISYLLDFVSFLIYQNCDCLGRFIFTASAFHQWFLPIATSSLEVLNWMIMEWRFWIKNKQKLWSTLPMTTIKQIAQCCGSAGFPFHWYTPLAVTQHIFNVQYSRLTAPDHNEWVANNRIPVSTQRFLGWPRGKHCNSLFHQRAMFIRKKA